MQRQADALEVERESLVAELPGYLRVAGKLLPEAGRRAIVQCSFTWLTMFAKNEHSNLSKAERNELAGLVDELRDIWLPR